MPSSSPVEVADRMSRQRARFTGLLAIIFIALQCLDAPHFANLPGDGVARRWGWAVFAAVLLINLGTGGGLLLGKGLRALLNDEVTRMNRNTALATGYWMAMITALAVFAADATGLSGFSAQQALHIVITASVATGLLAFSTLELRAHRDA